MHVHLLKLMQKAEAFFYTVDAEETNGREQRYQFRPIYFVFTVDLLLSKEHALHAIPLCNTQTDLFNSD